MRKFRRVSIRTSYFANYKRENGVSIALFTPKWFTGEVYTDLNPPQILLYEYKYGNCSKEKFERKYRQKLDKLDPNKVYNDLKGKVLLCYEKPNDFCHRHIVARWLEENIGIKVREI